jgi:hypothetical protein
VNGRVQIVVPDTERGCTLLRAAFVLSRLRKYDQAAAAQRLATTGERQRPTSSSSTSPKPGREAASDAVAQWLGMIGG